MRNGALTHPAASRRPASGIRASGEWAFRAPTVAAAAFVVLALTGLMAMPRSGVSSGSAMAQERWAQGRGSDLDDALQRELEEARRRQGKAVEPSAKPAGSSTVGNGPVGGEVLATLPAIAERPLAAPAEQLDFNDVSRWTLKSTQRLGGGLSTAAVSADRGMVAVGAGREGKVTVLDAAGKTVARFALPGFQAHTLSGIAFLPGRDALAVAIENKGIDVYGLDGKRLASIAMPDVYTFTLHALAGSRSLYLVKRRPPPAASGLDVLEVRGAELVRVASYDLGTMPGGIDVSRDGSRLLMEDLTNRRLSLIELPSQRIVWSITCSCNGAFGDGDRLVVVAGRLGEAAGDLKKPVTLALLSAADPSQGRVFEPGIRVSVEVTDVSPDGRHAAVRTTNIGRIYIMPVENVADAWNPDKVLEDKSRQNVVGGHFVAGGGFVSASGDNNVRFWGR